MKQRKYKYKKIILRISFFVFLFSFISFFERQFVPKLQELSHLHCKSTANQIIDHAAEAVINDLKLSEMTLVLADPSGDGYMANTQMINLFCTRFSEEITEQMLHIPNEKIGIPLGALTNLSFFANKGPQIPFSLKPAGAVNVDYISDIHSVGINQINYKIWLQISLEMKIINPIYQEKVIMERKIMLTDIVFSGKVPDHFFQLESTDEYLLTE